MAFQSLIQRQVDQAFALIADLGVDVTLTDTPAGSYSFGTATRTVDTDSLTATSVRGLVQATSRTLNNREKSAESSILFPSHRLPAQLDQYDRVIIAGDAVPWDVVSFEDDGYLTTATIRRTVV